MGVASVVVQSWSLLNKYALQHVTQAGTNLLCSNFVRLLSLQLVLEGLQLGSQVRARSLFQKMAAQDSGGAKPGTSKE